MRVIHTDYMMRHLDAPVLADSEGEANRIAAGMRARLAKARDQVEVRVEEVDAAVAEAERSDAEVTCPRCGVLVRRSDLEFPPSPEPEVIEMAPDAVFSLGGAAAECTRVRVSHGNDDKPVVRGVQIAFDEIVAHECGNRSSQST